MRNKDFAVFILSNGRPNKVITYKQLRDHGYTGKIFIVIDDLDSSRQEYLNLYGDAVIIFDKKEVAKQFDQGDNFSHMRSTSYVRNAIFKIAKDLNIKYFMQLDDDYTTFRYRFNSSLNYGTKKISKLDKIFDYLLDYYISSGIDTLALSQGGDFFGGSNSWMAEVIRIKRKAMNSFICSTDRPFNFVGKLNEDVNTYLYHGKIGRTFFTTSQVCLEQIQTQSNSGGMTEIYLENGTYVKSFYSVMYAPSSVKIGVLPSKHKRLHHLISWKNTVPVILREDVKKASAIDQNQTEYNR